MVASVLHNSNGVDYKVLGACEFKGSDVEYYKNSWQNYRYALLENNNSYVVASMVGETEWGNGFYFENKEDAESYYNSSVINYNHAIGI